MLQVMGIRSDHTDHLIAEESPCLQAGAPAKAAGQRTGIDLNADAVSSVFPYGVQ